MIIGIDASRALVKHRTGTENYSLQLISALLALGSGHRFRLYTNGRPPLGIVPDWSDRSVEIRSIPFPRLWTHLRLSAEMLFSSPDVLFVPAHVLPLWRPRRSVVTVHDLGFLHYPSAHRAGDRRYLEWSTGWNARRSLAVLADSDATRQDLIQAYAVDPSKVHVVYLGRDEHLAPVRSEERLAAVRQRYGVRSRYLLYVGTLQPRKNVGRLVEAFTRIASAADCEDVQLVLAGKLGWLCESLPSEIEDRGLTGRVVLPGYIDSCDLPALYSGALAHVFPSLYEGFGMPVLEAQACGVPVMTSNNSSLPEIAGDAALLVDPLNVDEIASAMHRLVADTDLRETLVRKGFENVKRFSWEKCARETLSILQDVARETAVRESDHD